MASSNTRADRQRGLVAWEQNFLTECVADYSGIWEAVVIARKHEPSLGRGRILESIEYLLSRGWILAGIPTANGREFTARHGTPQFIRKRIDNEWQELGHDPWLGDLVWFNATPAGESLARSFGDQPATEDHRRF